MTDENRRVAVWIAQQQVYLNGLRLHRTIRANPDTGTARVRPIASRPVWGYDAFQLRSFPRPSSEVGDAEAVLTQLPQATVFGAKGSNQGNNYRDNPADERRDDIGIPMQGLEETITGLRKGNVQLPG
ncbi:hypothetical protein BDW68DRAFT_147252 [Aspergillus falconensis]